MPVCVLTKGGTRACRDIDLFRKGDAFATTLTLLDDALVAKWEPHAASVKDRLKAMQEFKRAGIPVWVSIEPVIVPSEALAVILAVAELADHIKIGKLNYHPEANAVNWHKFMEAALPLLVKAGVNFYIKESLQPFMPVKIIRPHKEKANGKARKIDK